MKNKTEIKLEEIERILRKNKPLLVEKYSVKEVGIFGSYVRGEQKKASYLDLLVEFLEPVGLFHFIQLEEFLSGELGITVGLVMKDALKARIRDRVIKEAIYV